MAQTIRRAFVGLAGAAAVVGVVAAQTPQSPSTSQEPPRSRTAAQDRMDMGSDRSIVVTGCLKEEANVPGRQPNVVERAGILEDFILTNARVSTGSAAGVSSSSSAAGSAGAGSAGQSSAAAGSRSGSTQSAAGPDNDQDRNAAGSSGSQSQQSGSNQSARQAGSQVASSTGVMYKVEGLDDEELRRYANQQVEIRGTIDPDDARDAGVGSGSAAGRDALQADAADEDLPEIEAESIRMVAASCTTN
jgi:hypothetical protein